MEEKRDSYGLLPCVWAGPILTSLQADFKIKIISRELIATSQTIVFTQFVVLYARTNSLEKTLILQPALNDVKIGPARARTAHGNRPKDNRTQDQTKKFISW